MEIRKGQGTGKICSLRKRSFVVSGFSGHSAIIDHEKGHACLSRFGGDVIFKAVHRIGVQQFDKIRKILCCDWLAKRVRQRYLVHSGLCTVPLQEKFPRKSFIFLVPL